MDAEIFMIDGDSLLFELLGEESLDWSHGGQFLHLTYLLERFLQYFTDKGRPLAHKPGVCPDGTWALFGSMF